MILNRILCGKIKLKFDLVTLIIGILLLVAGIVSWIFGPWPIAIMCTVVGLGFIFLMNDSGIPAIFFLFGMLTLTSGIFMTIQAWQGITLIIFGLMVVVMAVVSYRDNC